MSEPPMHNRTGPRHGGDLTFAQRRYGRPEAGWLDLSTGINPNGWPAPTLALESLTRLPDRNALSNLLASARRAYQFADGIALVAVPGTEIAIRLLPLLAPGGSVAIVSPTYGSHADAWRAAGRAAIPIGSIDDLPAEAAIAVLANPNNPDGRTVDPARLKALAHRLADRDGLLIVDEAFADLDPGLSLAPHLVGLPAIVLRSFGKFYGLAGLRLGFVAGASTVVGALGSMLGDWPVSGAAIAIGTAALSDTAWQDKTRRRLARDAARLRDLFTGEGLSLVGGTDLFVLTAHHSAAAIHAGLAARGIWTRAFDDQPEWLRFGLPADDAAFDRLATALAAVMAAR